MGKFRTISAIFLILLVIISSTSFTIGMHLCKGEVQNISFLDKAAACEKEQSLPPCHRPVKPCCEDQTVIHTSDDFKASINHFHLSAPTVTDIPQAWVVISEVI